MKKGIRNAIAGGLFALASILPIKASAIDFNVDASVKNKYLAGSGVEFEDEPVFQSSITGNFSNGMYGALWSNVNSKTGLSEVDYTLGYSRRKIRGVKLDVSGNVYDLKDMGGKLNDNIVDVVVKLGLDGLISPNIKFAQNIDAGTFSNERGRRVTLSANYVSQIGRVPISANVAVDFRDRYFIDNSGFTVIQGKLSLPLKTGRLSVTPSARIQRAVDKDHFKNNSDFAISVGTSF